MQSMGESWAWNTEKKIALKNKYFLLEINIFHG